MTKLGKDDVFFKYDDYDFSLESKNILKRYMSNKHAHNVEMQTL